MNALNFEYESGNGCSCDYGQYVATHRGYTLQALPDTSPMNPWKDGDCEPPLFVQFDRGSAEYGLTLELPTLTREEITANLRDILHELECSNLLQVRERFDEYRRAYDAPELVNDALREYADNLHQSDRMELAAFVWRCKGREALTTTAHGYTQGDWAELLLVATEEWEKKVGAPRETHARQLQNAAKLYKYWAFGDVYGYRVLSPDGEEVGACWGFYGDNFDESGLTEQAIAEVDADIEYRRKEKQARTKTLVRNRVPLELRAA